MTLLAVGQQVMVAWQHENRSGPRGLVLAVESCRGYGGSQYMVRFTENGAVKTRLLYRYRLTPLPPLVLLAEAAE